MRSRSWRTFLVFLVFLIAIMPSAALTARAEGTPVADAAVPEASCHNQNNLDPTTQQTLQDGVVILVLCTAISGDGTVTTTFARMQIMPSNDGTPTTSLFLDLGGNSLVDLKQIGTTIIEVEKGNFSVTIKSFDAAQGYGNGSAYHGEAVAGSSKEITWTPITQLDSNIDLHKGDAVMLQNVVAAFEVGAGGATITATSIYPSDPGSCNGPCFKVPPG